MQIKILKTLVTIAIIFMTKSQVFSFGKPKHSKVEKELKKESATLTVVPNNGLQLTFEGPWLLRFKNPKGLELNKMKMDIEDFDKENGSFTFNIKTKTYTCM